MEKVARIEFDDLKRNITLKTKNDNMEYGIIEIDLKILYTIILRIINIMLQSIMNKQRFKKTYKTIMKVRLMDQRPFQP